MRDADAAWNADPLQDAFTDRPGPLHQVAAHPLKSDEGLIDRIDLLGWAQPRSQAHHPVAHVAVQREVGRQSHQTRFLLQMLDPEPRCSHLDAQVLGFVGARDGAAVVVGENDDRPAVQAGTEHPLARDIEIVAIDQGVHGRIARIG
ncbi:hypothetical protein D9M70_594700 [compost metagenome]